MHSIRISIAKSRRPVAVCRSQMASSAATWPGSSALGSPASRQVATAGTDSPSGSLIKPSTCRKPSSDRSAVTVSFADLFGLPGQVASTNPVTSAALRVARSRPPAFSRPARNGRTKSA